MMQRRLRSAGLKALLEASRSERALIMRFPTEGSFAQWGTRPQWKASMRRIPPVSYTA